MTKILDLLLFLVLCLSGPAAVAAEIRVTIDDDEIPVAVHAAEGGDLVVWLSSEYGETPRRAALAQALAATGIEVWRPDLHAAWFLPVGRYSLNDVPTSAVIALLTEAIERSGKRVFLMAGGRTVALALNGVRAWQTTGDDTARLAGLIAISPRLFVRTPQGGETAEYLPVAGATNLPIYVLQPQDSGGFWRIGQDVAQLQSGGSPVFVHRLPKVSDGFESRPDFTDAEEAMSRRLPAILRQAMTQLAAYSGTPAEAAPLAGEIRTPERRVGTALLRPYPGQRAAPALKLPSLRGAPVDLVALEGKVVMVNFWATWCPPCVEEIPSLQRLYRRLRDLGLEILAVDVGETVETMQAFLEDKPVEFPVLMDSDGEALRRWGVYAFPTTLVLDRSHRIRYAVFGAFNWSSAEVVDALMPLLLAAEGQ